MNAPFPFPREGGRELSDPRIVAESAGKCHDSAMCFHLTASGLIIPLWSRTAYDEVMLHCARIGFKP